MQAVGFLFSGDFWALWSIGLVGWVFWLLLTWGSKDRRVEGAPSDVMLSQWRMAAIALVSHWILAVLMWQVNQLNVAFSIVSGYGAYSVVSKLLAGKLASVKSNGGDTRV